MGRLPDMALSAYEELAFAELEAQFHAGDPPRRPPSDPPYLMLSGACVLAGAALLVAAHHRGLLIGISDFFGFATSSIASALGLAGYAVLLAAAFLLGRRQNVGRGNEEDARALWPVPAQRR